MKGVKSSSQSTKIGKLSVLAKMQAFWPFLRLTAQKDVDRKGLFLVSYDEILHSFGFGSFTCQTFDFFLVGRHFGKMMPIWHHFAICQTDTPVFGHQFLTKLMLYNHYFLVCQ